MPPAKKLPGRLRQKAAWLPWDWEKNLPAAVAIQAVADGRASDEQQRLAFRTIVEDICGLGDISYSPDDPRETDVSEGKRMVGAQLSFLARAMFHKLKGD